MSEQSLATEILSLPLFLLNDMISERDMAEPDLIAHIKLNEHMMAELCQNPSEEASHCLYVTEYELELCNETFSEIVQTAHCLELHLKRGPVLAAVLSDDEGPRMVSPELEFMPEFDVGIDIDEEDDEALVQE